jgi:hypothetical protein
VRGPYDEVWKISTVADDRQVSIWPRIQHDAWLRAHARERWMTGPAFSGPPIKPDIITMTLDRTRDAVARIRANGGDVVFVRPPSAPPLRAHEDKRLPRSKGWDALLRVAHVEGIHSDDLPAAQGLILPEYSHLTHLCALVFTDAYVRALARITSRIHLRADAPPVLQPRDCVNAAARP